MLLLGRAWPVNAGRGLRPRPVVLVKRWVVARYSASASVSSVSGGQVSHGAGQVQVIGRPR